jgi:hypothetical protein
MLKCVDRQIVSKVFSYSRSKTVKRNINLDCKYKWRSYKGFSSYRRDHVSPLNCTGYVFPFLLVTLNLPSQSDDKITELYLKA